MKLTLRPLSCEKETRWRLLTKAFNVELEYALFLERVWSDSPISSQIDDELALKILDSSELRNLLEDIYPHQPYFQTLAPANDNFHQLWYGYARYVFDFCQNSCREDIINTEPGKFFIRLRKLDNNRIGNLSQADEKYINRGLERLAKHKKISVNEYEGLVGKNLFEKCNKKGCGIAVKLLLIFGKHPKERLAEAERSRFEKYRRFGERCFSEDSASLKATNKALSITAWRYLELSHEDLKNLWEEMTRE